MADPTYILTNTPIADGYPGASAVKTAERISPTVASFESRAQFIPRGRESVI